MGGEQLQYKSVPQTCADSGRTPVHRPTSIKDIARMANVSSSTVSRALQNSPLISRRTAEKIQHIAKQSGYRVSAIARGLVTQRTKSIGVVVTTIADPFVSEVVNGIEDCCNDHGYSVFLANSNADPDRETKVVHSFSERRVEGIVVTSSRVGALYLPLLSDLNPHCAREQSAPGGIRELRLD
jgi:DNA-binding LacI/PurR family transcriptional regulator